jgi:DnaJ homolog subfamily A member 2
VEAQVRFQQAHAAYDILRNAEQRAIYDERGLDGVDGRAGSARQEDFYTDEEMAELFAQMFGGGGLGGRASGGGKKSQDAVHQVEVTLEDLYKGKHVKLMSKRKIVCSACKGYAALVGEG